MLKAYNRIVGESMSCTFWLKRKRKKYNGVISIAEDRKVSENVGKKRKVGAKNVNRRNN